MGLGLPAGGHLTHGWNVSITGKYFRSVAVRRAQGHRAHRPRRGARAGARRRSRSCCGAAAPRFRAPSTSPAFASIADEVGAILVADIAHIAGPRRRRRAPVAGRARRRGHDHHAQDAARPARRHAHVQGAARAARSTGRCSPACRAGRTTTPPPASRSRSRRRRPPAFKDYAHADRRRTRKALAGGAGRRAASTLVSGGTDNHLILVDLTNKNVPGKMAAQALDQRRHRAQLQLGAVRSAQAVRSVGHPPRHAGGHQPRHGRRPR